MQKQNVMKHKTECNFDQIYFMFIHAYFIQEICFSIMLFFFLMSLY